MNEQDADRIRDAIARGQTKCRCGHMLAACADCRGWWAENGQRIADEFEWWYVRALELGKEIGTQWGAEAAEEECHDVYHHDVRGDR